MMKRILMMIMCVVMALSLFGCGQSNEKKYMSLRNEVETEMKAYDVIVRSTPYGASKENHEKALSELTAIQKRVMPKLEEMEKLAKEDLKLKNDFEKFGINNAMLLKNAVNRETKIVNGTDELSKAIKRDGYDPSRKHSLFKD